MHVLDKPHCVHQLAHPSDKLTAQAVIKEGLSTTHTTLITQRQTTQRESYSLTEPTVDLDNCAEMQVPTTTRIVSLLLLILLISNATEGGVALYGVCQAGCATVVMACYGAAGVTFGTITAGVGTPAAILACNSAFGVCSAKCAAVTLFLPTP